MRSASNGQPELGHLEQPYLLEVGAPSAIQFHNDVRKAMSWRTGLTQIVNNTSSQIYFVSWEHPEYEYQVDAGSFYPPVGRWENGAVFPWCLNSYEVASKAFRIYLGPDKSAPLALYVFQWYTDDTIYFLPGPQPTPFNSKISCGEGPSSWCDLIIESNHTATAVASTPYDVIGTIGFISPPTPYAASAPYIPREP